MKHTDKRGKRATYPVTIQTPYGVLRMAYEMDMEPCPDCGQCHGSVTVLDASPRLKTAEAVPFLDMLPDLLMATGELAFLHTVSGLKTSRATVN